ncbi:hypothetical protein H1S01_04255 [Heliobacterium chlorum]|uniref:RelA/SpoT domain-containing protein n=1 Tax=Heliobacterium chlorum TaxID=2698 RepID=A0ABR7SYW2_HELCL|nr:hypothetical protein [Heliobacterium chlorum]MBC9783724.1 hypothetical protein [Heliobacterium chlorum]
MELTCQQLESILASYRQMELELRVKLDALRGPLEIKYGRPVILFIESRTKKAKSLIEKARRYGWPVNEGITKNIKDIAGLRVIVQHLDDISRVVDILKKRSDMRLVNEKDFLRNPKASGYRSYHLIIEYDMYAPEGPITRFAEIQVRTVGQHFWAVLQHSMMYKYGLEVPTHIAENLRLIAEETNKADEKMMVMRQAVSRDLEVDEIRLYAKQLAHLLRRTEPQRGTALSFDPSRYFSDMTILELSFQLGRKGYPSESFDPQELARCSCCKAPFLLHEEVRAIIPQNDDSKQGVEPVRLCKVCYSMILPVLRWEFSSAPLKEKNKLRSEWEEASHMHRKFQQFFIERIQSPLANRLQKASVLLGEHLMICPSMLNIGTVTLFKAAVGDRLSVQIDSEWDPQNGEDEVITFFVKLDYHVAGSISVTYRYPEIEWDEFHEPELVEPESFIYKEEELERLFSLIDGQLKELRSPRLVGVSG